MLGALLEGTRRHGRRDFLVYGDDRYTFADHLEVVARLAQWLAAERGVGKGDRVVIGMRAFPEPDRFDIERDWSELPQHLGFGLGAHFCLGAPLARAEIAIALTTLYQRLPGLRVTTHDEPRRLPGLTFRGWQGLDVTYADRI